MTRTPYQKADEAAARITSKIRTEFRHNRLALFDELNIVGVKKHVHKLYQNVYKTVKQEFLKVINEIYQTIYDEAVEMGFDGDIRNLDEAWIESFFNMYNPVTKYVFSNEIERKESRLFEALVSNELERLQSYAYAERLITTQIEQYAIDLEDAIAKVVYEDTGVEKVMWVAEDDDRTCGACNGLDGQIFELVAVPPKQHYRCRCYFVPVKE
jgi:SPP1 gp7 family putative phage head morphogenesis protein